MSILANFSKNPIFQKLTFFAKNRHFLQKWQNLKIAENW
jgi:hypothetical protein